MELTITCELISDSCFLRDDYLFESVQYPTFCILQVLQTDMTYVCPNSGMPRKGSLPAGITEDLLRDAPNLATALKQVEFWKITEYLYMFSCSFLASVQGLFF